jgi:3-oxoacyl-[acyl-carrier-protein] synthase II
VLTDVCVTGMAAWSAIGRTLAEHDASLRAGLSGRRPVARFDVSNPIYRTRHAASLTNEEELRAETDETLITDLALAVTREALADAGLSVAPPGCGMALATSHGANLAFMKLVKARLGMDGCSLDAHTALAASPTVVGQVAARVGVLGPVFTIATACASGTNAIGLGMELIRDGEVDVMLAGGADLYTPLSFSGFNSLKALAKGPCRPLDRDRDGMMLGDGAAVLVLESTVRARARGAAIRAFIAGHATANEAYHPTAPSPHGEGAVRVMRTALRSARARPDEIDYINLHATGTPANDSAELEAVATVFGARAEQIPISSTKSMTGHALGAAGAIEALATILGMNGGYAPPTIELETPLEQYARWNYVRDVARSMDVTVAMSNSFGFSGHLSSLVLVRGGVQS